MASGRMLPFGFDSLHFPQCDYEPSISVFRARRILNYIFEVEEPNDDMRLLFRDLVNSDRKAKLVKGTELKEEGFVDEPLL